MSSLFFSDGVVLVVEVGGGGGAIPPVALGSAGTAVVVGPLGGTAAVPHRLLRSVTLLLDLLPWVAVVPCQLLLGVVLRRLHLLPPPPLAGLKERGSHPVLLLHYFWFWFQGPVP